MNKLSRNYLTIAMAALLGGFAAATQAQVTIGSWQGSSSEGWIDWGNGLSITDPANTASYSFVSGTVPGYSQSLRVQKSGWNQDLSIKLENLSGGNAAFLDNHLLTFTISVNGTGSSSGWDQINSLVVNAPGWGFNQVDFSHFTATGDQSNNPGNFYFWGEGFQSQTVTVDYSSLLPSITATPTSGWIELIFTTNNGGGAPNYLDFNNIVLSGGPVPEPSALALIGLGTAGMFWLRRKK